MKILITTIALCLILSYIAEAQGDTLVVKLKNNQIEKIAIEQIQRIQFENITSVDEFKPARTELRVEENYPNPFSENTTLEFEIGNSGNVEIIIFDNSGKQIQILKCENCPAGLNSLEWNCLDAEKNRVQSGVYYYEVKFGVEAQSRKMLLVK